METRAVPSRQSKNNASARAGAGRDVDLLPIEPSGRRSRLRRGGPRTPLPLLPLRLTGDLFVPVDFEAAYQEACRRRRLA